MRRAPPHSLSLRPQIGEQHSTLSKQRVMHGKPAFVVNVSKLPELIHEEIHPRPGRTHHFRQHILPDFPQDGRDLIPLAVARQQQQRSRQPLFD